MKRSRKPICLKPLLLLIALLSCAQTSLATTVIIPPDDQMIVEARAIVRGRVLAIEAGLDEQQDRIYTYVTLKVQEVLKGQITQRKIVLKQPGGEYGNRGSLVFGAPTFAVGENVLLYLDTWRDGSLRVHQMLLGKFAVIKDPGTGALFAVRNAPDASVQMLGQSSKGPITNRMELSAYTEMVRGRLAANRRESREFEASAYGGVPVLERPTGHIPGSQESDLEPQFHLWNPRIRWFEADTGESVVFKVNTESAPPQVENDLIATTNAWSSVAGCSLRVISGGTTTTCGLFAFDGTNTISFNNCDGYFSGSGNCSGGILAVTSISNYDRNQTRVVNGVTFYKALEANLTFNPFASCYFSDHCQLQEIMTHEMGHALGLHHSWDPTFGGTPSASDQIATMYWVAHFDGRCASLRQDDFNGITFVYPATGGGPGPLTIVSTSPLGTGTVGSVFSRQLIATGGTIPYTWSLVSGSLPDGLTLSPTGTVGGTPTATGSFSATVQVTDSRSQTAQKVLTFTVTLPPVEIVTSTLPAATKGVGFNQQLNAAGGRPPFTWSVTAGALPGGLGLAAATGIISGTPNATGSFSFTVTATDADSHTASKPFSITVVAPPLSVAAIPALETLMGLSFNYQLSASGGTSPYTWSSASGALPPGLNLNSTSGLISGTPTAGGLFTFPVTVRDAVSVSATATVQIKVIDPATIPAINKVKFKGGRKLFVIGDRINSAAVLLVDGNQVPYTAGDGQLLVKPISLAPGSHEIRIVNPGGVSSAPYLLTVE